MRAVTVTLKLFFEIAEQGIKKERMWKKKTIRQA